MFKKITPIMEDYLEAVYHIGQRRDFVRTKDIARELNVSSPSVTEMLGKLTRRRLVSYEKYYPVTLTSEGEKIAKVVAKRHETLSQLLKTIMVSEKTAQEDACKIEHQLSPESIEQLGKLVEFVENAPTYPRWLEHFRRFCATGEYECEHKK